MIAQFRYVFEFPHKKRDWKEQKTKSLLLEIETGSFLYSLGGYKHKNRQKIRERWSWSVKRKNRAKIYSWFYFGKRELNKRQSKMNQAKILLHRIWRQNS